MSIGSDTIVLYHVTSQEAAESIMRQGFQNGHVRALFDPADPTGSEANLEVVSLADLPVDESEGAASSERCIEVLVPVALAAEHELTEELVDGAKQHFLNQYPELRESGRCFNAIVTEWAIPASKLNALPRRVLSPDECEALRERDRGATLLASLRWIELD